MPLYINRKERKHRHGKNPRSRTAKQNRKAGEETERKYRNIMEKDAKIYVAGHKGLVGSAICRALQKNGYTNIITRSHKELDLCRQDAVEAFFAEEKPDYVFLAAAKVGGIMANSEALADFMYEKYDPGDECDSCCMAERLQEADVFRQQLYLSPDGTPAHEGKLPFDL